ncbi:MAG: two-component system response regulator [Candidatus Omnitrophota bacterium]
MDKKPKILIVDDEEKNLMLLEGILLPQGYETVKAKDGEAALEAVRSSSPDVVLLDVMMPKMNGIEVCRRIKQSEETQMIPVVIVTALDGRKDRIGGIEAGADDFLTKPVDGTELTIRVKNLLKVKSYHDHMKSYNEILENDVAARTRDLKEANETVKRSYLDTIYRLSVAAEYRDEETGRHILRMSRSSAAVAKKMGLPPPEVEKMLYASPMHDVGKIGIPDRILLKPAKLDAEEWEIMKQHSTIGAKILSDSSSELIQMAKSIALTHHEKYDGSGYPGGLSGEHIPLEGRITAIADVFDALTSKRPYKPAFSIEKSVDIIKDSVGTHFDPKVAEAFFEAFDEIMNIIRGIPDKEVQVGV